MCNEQDCNCDDHCDQCSVVLTLSAKCTDNKTMQITSKMLVLEAQGYDNAHQMRGNEMIGRPATGASPFSLPFFLDNSFCASFRSMLRGDVAVQARLNEGLTSAFVGGVGREDGILLLKLRMGQEIKIKCIAIKVRASPSIPPSLPPLPSCPVRRLPLIERNPRSSKLLRRSNRS